MAQAAPDLARVALDIGPASAAESCGSGRQLPTIMQGLHGSGHQDNSDGVNEAQQQLAYADIVLLNKIDLINGEDVPAVEVAIRRHNSSVQVHSNTDSLTVNEVIHRIICIIVWTSSFVEHAPIPHL
jgi:hypothetical protein